MLPVAQFNNFVIANHLFNAQNKILAAVSGGMDSVFLVHMLHAAGYNFAIAHCNFKLRGAESDGDEQFCRRLAKKLGVEFYNTSFETEAYAAQNKISIQMAARDLRYQWFESTRQQNGFNVIAVAHHQNDTVETILLNLTRGTGIAGLHGIRPKNCNLVRPLLFLTRDEIQSAVKSNNISYREDSSNSSVKYARNKIRHQVIPALRELNPQLEKTFAAEARYFAELEQLLQLQLEKIKADVCEIRGDETLFNIAKLKQLIPQQLLLHGLLDPYGFSETTVADIIGSLDKHSGRVFESPTHKLVLDRENLIISLLKDGLLCPIEIIQGQTNAVFGEKQIKVKYDDDSESISPDKNIAVIDANKLIFPLTLRAWQQGDTFYPLGMKTRKKLSDFFISLKIPLHSKTTVPILINGNGDILWVCGYRISDKYKITPATKKISIFELTEI